MCECACVCVSMTSLSKIHSLKSPSLEVFLDVMQRHLSYRTALPTLHIMCFVGGLKWKEQNLAQIYARSLTLKTNHPGAKSSFPGTSAGKKENKEREALRGKGAENEERM